MRRRTQALTILLALAVTLAACQQQAVQGITTAGRSIGDDRAELVTPAAANARPARTPVDLSQDRVRYQVTERMTLVNRGDGSPAKQNVWIALIDDVDSYQDVLDMQISPSRYQLIVDEYGNRYAEFDLSDMAPGTSIEIQLDYLVAVNRVTTDLSSCEGDLPQFFTQPELHVESANPQIVELSQQLSEGRQTACQQVRAFYDYVADNLVYTYNGRNWGAQAAMGEMGADCTEFASLMMALSRAAGIPARYLEGLYYLTSEPEDLARTEHSWLEVYLPGAGWTPMDPTLGQSSLTRTAYFAAMPPNHIIVTRGRNPSTLRGGNYWTYLYWPGNSTDIRVEDFGWDIQPVQP